MIIEQQQTVAGEGSYPAVVIDTAYTVEIFGDYSIGFWWATTLRGAVVAHTSTATDTVVETAVQAYRDGALAAHNHFWGAHTNYHLADAVLDEWAAISADLVAAGLAA